MAHSIVSRKEAKAQGLTRYFTGKACKHGHLCERFVHGGRCQECSRIALENKRRSRGIQKRSKISRDEFLKRRRGIMGRWRDNNRALYRAIARKRRVRHRARLLELDRLRTAKNPHANRARVKKWVQENPEAAKASARTRRCKKRNAEGSHTAVEIVRLAELQGYRCANCKCSIRHAYHADHITPIARGGSNWIWNIQLLCPRCNCRKNAQDPFMWAKRQGRLL